MDELLPILAEKSAEFALLGYCVWQIISLFRFLIEKNAAMAERLVETNASLTAALRATEESRIEQRRDHEEQTVLIKMALDNLARHVDG